MVIILLMTSPFQLALKQPSKGGVSCQILHLSGFSLLPKNITNPKTCGGFGMLSYRQLISTLKGVNVCF